MKEFLMYHKGIQWSGEINKEYICKGKFCIRFGGWIFL